ncbi:MAG: ADP-ribosylation factor-like protein [Candidatus Thorarchaeota archaeon]
MGEQNNKFLILGLDNSGKTTILLSLKGDTNLLSFLSLKPTRGISIEEFQDKEFKTYAWDFGGQEEYRADHISNIGKYIKGVDEILYVIDIQDYNRYNQALIYLKDLINSIEKERYVVELSIFLHKYDPNLKNKPEFKDIDEKVNFLINKQIFRIIPANFKYKIYRSSVYTVFEKNLIFSN